MTTLYIRKGERDNGLQNLRNGHKSEKKIKHKSNSYFAFYKIMLLRRIYLFSYIAES
jgi:hypothetical protein